MAQATATHSGRDTLQVRLEREHGKPLPEILHWALNSKRNRARSVRGAARLLRERVPDVSDGAIQYFVYRYGFRRNTSWLYDINSPE